MRFADPRNHADVWPAQSGQFFDFARRACAQLQRGVFMIWLQPQQAQRQTDVIVVILRARESANFERSTVSIISRVVVLPTLPVTATTRPLNWLRCHAASFHSACKRIVDSQRPPSGPRFDIPACDHHSGRSAHQRIFGEARTVEPRTLQSPKHRLGLHAAAVGHNRPDVRRLAVARRHRSQPQLAAGNFAKFGECKRHFQWSVVRKRV